MDTSLQILPTAITIASSAVAHNVLALRAGNTTLSTLSPHFGRMTARVSAI
jgi:hypothetical protein